MRIVRLVAIVAGHAAGVLRGHNLRKRLGLGGVLLVASSAESGDGGQLGDIRRRVSGMPGERPVTGLAGHVGVPAGGADLAFLFVAQNAGGLPGVGNRMLPDGCCEAERSEAEPRRC